MARATMKACTRVLCRINPIAAPISRRGGGDQPAPQPEKRGWAPLLSPPPTRSNPNLESRMDRRARRQRSFDALGADSGHVGLGSNVPRCADVVHVAVLQ